MSLRLKNWPKTATTIASDAYIALDGTTNGTQRMLATTFVAQAAATIKADPSTHGLCPLNGSQKVDGTYLPTSADTPKGEWNATSNTPTLADGTGTAGDYYDVTTAGSVDLGSGSISYTVGDVVKYNGTIWYKIDSVANLFDGTSTQAGAATAGDYYQTGEVVARTAGGAPVAEWDFDGQDDDISMGDPATLDFGTGSYSVYVEFDLPETPSATVYLAAKRNSGAGWYLGVDSSAKLISRLADSGGNADATDGDALATGHHRALVSFDRGGNMVRTVDGDTYGTNTSIAARSLTVSNTANFYIGRSANATPGRFKGRIARVAVFDYAVSDADAQAWTKTGAIPRSEQYGASSELVSNGEFTSATTGWAGTNATITQVASGTDPGTTSPGADAGCLKVEDTGSNARATQGITCVIGQRYVTTGYYYNLAANTGSGGMIDISSVESSASGSVGQHSFNVDDAWTEFTIPWIATATTMYIRIIPDGNNNTDISYADSISTTAAGMVGDWQAQDSDFVNGVAPDRSSGGNNGAITSASGTQVARALHIDAEAPAADENLLSVSVGGTEKLAIDEDGTIRQEGLATDAPVAKYGADAITTAGTVSHQIPIDIGGTTYYLVAYTHGS